MAETNRTPEDPGTPLPADRPEHTTGADATATTPAPAVPYRPGSGDADTTAAEPADTATPSTADAAGTRTAAVPADTTPAPPPAPAGQTVLAPAQDVPVAPKRASNRLVGTAWVLLAAGLFEAVYIALVALLVLLLGGAAAVGPETAAIASSPFGWLPVIFFFLLFELTVLLLNRAGRFTYVVASLIVGVLVYVISVLLVSVIVRGSLGDASTLAQTFLLPWSLLTGLVAREVMLWTGFAIGARGKRVRRRNKAAKQAYEAEVAERRDAGALA
jgi:hypothetical protein